MLDHSIGAFKYDKALAPKDHGSYSKIIAHAESTNAFFKCNSHREYVKVNHSNTAFPICSTGDDGVNKFYSYACYRPMGNYLTSNCSSYPFHKPNKDGFSILLGHMWFDGLKDKRNFEACLAWFNYVMSPESPWYRVTMDNKLEILRHKEDFNKGAMPLPAGTPYGYILSFHEEDSAPHLFHLMIAARAAMENEEFCASWYFFHKTLGFDPVRSFLLANCLIVNKTSTGMCNVKLGHGNIDRFQFFMMEGSFCEWRYRHRAPDLKDTYAFKRKNNYQDVVMSFGRGSSRTWKDWSNCAKTTMQTLYNKKHSSKKKPSSLFASSYIEDQVSLITTVSDVCWLDVLAVVNETLVPLLNQDYDHSSKTLKAA